MSLAGAARKAAGFLACAASPTFALLALLTVVRGGGEHGSAGAMATMYLLMSAFHAPAWLNRIGSSGAPR